MTHVEFAEREADKLMAGHLEDMAIITRETNVTFTVIAAALSAMFGYLLKLLAGPASFWSFPVGVATAHLGVLGLWLVCRGMMAQAVWHRGNEPKNLLTAGIKAYSIERVREAECLNLQARIEDNRNRNYAAARLLNRVRLGFVFTPAIFLAAVAVEAAVLAVVRMENF